jgi:transcriptional regulator with XRE-family HTH domain
MPAREGPVDRATRKAVRAVADLGRELRDARLAHGLSQGAVGGRIGLSAAQISRIERGRSPEVSVYQLARALSVVGLDLSTRAYAGAQPIRDAAHAELLSRLRTQVPNGARWRAEVPLPAQGDQRAWDAVIAMDGQLIAVEAETRPRDLQAQARSLALKRRDGGIENVILLLSDSRHNRRLVRLYRDILVADFPLDGHLAMDELVAGRLPSASTVVLL